MRTPSGNFLDFNSHRSPFLGSSVIQTGYWQVFFNLESFFLILLKIHLFIKDLTYFVKRWKPVWIRSWLFIMITHIYNCASIFENCDKSLIVDSCMYSVWIDQWDRRWLIEYYNLIRILPFCRSFCFTFSWPSCWLLPVETSLLLWWTLQRSTKMCIPIGSSTFLLCLLAW